MAQIYVELWFRVSLEITVVSIGWYLGGTVGLGTLLFAFGIGQRSTPGNQPFYLH